MYFTLLPPGTIVFIPDGRLFVVQFPTPEDAIVFFEFIRGFVSGEFAIEAVEADGSGDNVQGSST